MKKIELRKNGTRRVYTVYTDDELEGQKIKCADDSFREECDVNTILRRFMKTGEIEYRKNPGVYQDVSEISDLEGSLNQINKANAAFDALPADIRFRFGNSPIEMINFLQNPENYEESIKMGLRVRPETGPGSAGPEPSVSAVVKKQKSQSQSQSQKHKYYPKSAVINDDELNDDDNPQ